MLRTEPITIVPRRRQPAISVADMADAVFEMASAAITEVEGMESGVLIGPDPKERRHLEWRARCLVAAHAELRKQAANGGAT